MYKFILYISVIYFFNCSIACGYTICDTMIDGIMMKGQCKGALKHGRFVGYHKNGAMAWEVHFKNNVLHGKFKHFYPNGNLHFTGSYKNGVLHSSFVQYNQDNGMLQANFKKGVLHNWLYVFYNGQKVEALKYYYGKLAQKLYLD